METSPASSYLAPCVTISQTLTHLRADRDAYQPEVGRGATKLKKWRLAVCNLVHHRLPSHGTVWACNLSCSLILGRVCVDWLRLRLKRNYPMRESPQARSRPVGVRSSHKSKKRRIKKNVCALMLVVIRVVKDYLSSSSEGGWP